MDRVPRGIKAREGAKQTGATRVEKGEVREASQGGLGLQTRAGFGANLFNIEFQPLIPFSRLKHSVNT